MLGATSGVERSLRLHIREGRLSLMSTDNAIETHVQETRGKDTSAPLVWNHVYLQALHAVLAQCGAAGRCRARAVEARASWLVLVVTNDRGQSTTKSQRLSTLIVRARGGGGRGAAVLGRGGVVTEGAQARINNNDRDTGFGYGNWHSRWVVSQNAPAPAPHQRARAEPAPLHQLRTST